MTKQMQDAYIVAATRTAVGKAPRGAFKSTRPDSLLAHVLRSVLAQAPTIDPQRIEDVIVGCAMPEYEQGMNVARIGVLLAGLPNSVAGMTVNRFCSSGLNAVSIAADRIRTGEADIMIAAGTESMSMIPMLGRLAINEAVFARGENIGIAYGMGLTAEKVAAQWKVSREDQDAFALASHQKALAAQAAGDFDAEVSPITVNEDVPDLATDKDRHEDEGDPARRGSARRHQRRRSREIAPGVRGQGLGHRRQQLANVRWRGRVDPGVGKVLRELNLTPLARWVGYAVAGVPPEIMGVGPIAAIPKVLKTTGIKQDQLDWIELNEAFAAQAIAVMRDLGLDPAKVNPLGGAIALGHPLGATGAIRTATITHGMRRRKQKYGMVSMCVGTGMGAAGIFEAV